MITKSPPSVYISETYLSPSDIGREQFENIIRLWIWGNPDDTITIMELYKDMKAHFSRIHRRFGDRYFEHLKGVTLIGILEMKDNSVNHTLARLLHDASEDIYMTRESIAKRYGQEVAALVSGVTNPTKTGNPLQDIARKKAHYTIMGQFPELGTIKSPDRVSNLRTHEVRLIVDGIMSEKLLTQKILRSGRDQYEETEKYILPVVEKTGWLFYAVLYREWERFKRALDHLEWAEIL